jgi:hypothetical protein
MLLIPNFLYKEKIIESYLSKFIHYFKIDRFRELYVKHIQI